MLHDVWNSLAYLPSNRRAMRPGRR